MIFQGKNYDSAKFIDLTTEELKFSKFPDEAVVSVWAKFISKIERNYTAVHVPFHVDGPYILLCGEDKDEHDFTNLEEIFKKITKGKSGEEITHRFNDICKVIRVSQDLTQSKIADFVEKYKSFFGDVSIPAAYFRNLENVGEVEALGLPLKKIVL